TALPSHQPSPRRRAASLSLPRAALRLLLFLLHVAGRGGCILARLDPALRRYPRWSGAGPGNLRRAGSAWRRVRRALRSGGFGELSAALGDATVGTVKDGRPWRRGQERVGEGDAGSPATEGTTTAGAALLMRRGTTAKPTDTEIRAERRGGAVRVEGRGDGGIAKRAGAGDGGEAMGLSGARLEAPDKLCMMRAVCL
ncbi:unnamed protein product, partial [Urochloa humidicola]